MATDNANGRAVKMRKAVHETAAASLRRVIDNRKAFYRSREKAALCSLFFLKLNEAAAARSITLIFEADGGFMRQTGLLRQSTLAYKTLQEEINIRLVLPWNVIVYGADESGNL